jgi:flagellar basal-body rod protein FlgF
MDRLAFNAAATINEQRLARQVLAHEMANINTTGFKRSYEVSLKAFKADGQGFDSRHQPQAVNKDLIQLRPGPLIATGRELDILMNDQTVLGVNAPNGELAYTRRGDLRVNANGVLETGVGHVVRGEDGPVTVPSGFRVTISGDGGVYAIDPAQPGVQQPVLITRLQLRDASQTPLSRREDGLFKVDGQPAGTDFATGPLPTSVTTKALEGSNVNPMEAMVKMIEQSRSFEHQVRLIKESKSNDESGASMLRLPS